MNENSGRPDQGSHSSEQKITLNDKNEILVDIPPHLLGLDLMKASADAHQLALKQEFHITMLGGKASKRITEILENSPEYAQERGAIQELAEGMNFQFEFQPRFFYLRRAYNDPNPIDPQKTIPETRETIIQLVVVPQMHDFQEKLRNLVGMEEEIEALPHVTLYSTSSREDKKQRGIGIYSIQDLEVSNAQEIASERWYEQN